MTENEREIRDLLGEALDVWVGVGRPGSLSWRARAKLALAKQDAPETVALAKVE
jgi:hypothetical protein